MSISGAGHTSSSQVLAERAYECIEQCANNNSIIQGLSGVAGFPFTLGTDVAVIPLVYVPLWNDIRGIYAHTEIREDVIVPFVTKIVPELLTDLGLDKLLGAVPVAGIYFNAICAKAMTWRLGTLFTFASAFGPQIPESTIVPALELIRKVFPQDQMFKFQTPGRAEFVRFVLASGSGDEAETRARIERALEAFES